MANHNQTTGGGGNGVAPPPPPATAAPAAPPEPDLHDFTSDEKLPEAWPEEFPGITKFAPAEPTASLQFDSGDIVLVNSLSNLAPGALIDEMKAMHAIACRLAVDEEREKTRGKILRVLMD